MSFGEIILIFILALFVFGPKELPIIASKIGIVIVKFRQTFNDFKQELYNKSGLENIKIVKSDIDDLYSNVKENLTSYPKANYHQYDDFIENIPLFYQPELDFDREPELFDEVDDIDEPRTNK